MSIATNFLSFLSGLHIICLHPYQYDGALWSFSLLYGFPLCNYLNMRFRVGTENENLKPTGSGLSVIIRIHSSSKNIFIFCDHLLFSGELKGKEQRIIFFKY